MTATRILLIAAFVGAGCEDLPSQNDNTTPLTSAEAVDGTDTTPAIRHDGYDGAQPSGTRLMRPEVLHNVLENSFPGLSTSLNRIDSNSDSYWSALGGINYDSSTERGREPTVAMSLVMNHYAQTVCNELITGATTSRIESSTLAWNTEDNAASSADIVARGLRSRPMTDEEETHIREFFDYMDSGTDGDGKERLDRNTGWQAYFGRSVCVYFFLGNGSFVLY